LARPLWRWRSSLVVARRKKPRLLLRPLPLLLLLPLLRSRLTPLLRLPLCLRSRLTPLLRLLLRLLRSSNQHAQAF
jgi:hypothetical protein